MSIQLSKTSKLNENTIASVYSDYLFEGMGRNQKLMHIECDLGLSIVKFDIFKFAEQYPDRFVNVGIAEANAVGFACGLSHQNFIPYVHSFGPFMSRRVADQVFMAGAYSNANVKLIGSDPGIVAAYNGGTHMPFEDIAIMRSIPTIKIVEPADNVSAKALFPLIEKDYGMYYIRLARKNVVDIYEEGTSFEIGKGNILCEGTDVTIFAMGVMLEEALKAVHLLKNENISAKLVDMFTIRPLDRDLIIQSAKETGAIVTCENHSVNGGLGDAVSQVVFEEHIVPVERIGVKEKFGQVGDMDFLKEEYNLTAKDIANAAKVAISKKESVYHEKKNGHFS
ncbi:transketolase C-terminal domain-containing protein [Vallitaleaceae bacterium 9-2]